MLVFLNKKGNYMKRLAPEYLDHLQVYQAGKPIEELVREKGLTRVSKLASNENPLGPSPYAIRAMTNALWDVHRYPDMYAYSLKNALANLYQLDHENIIIGNGSEGIMGNIARAFIQPGDEILTSEKTFIGFNILAKSAGANLVATPMTLDYRYDVKAMAALITEKTKIIYIANPNNPTGTYIKKMEFDYLMKFTPKHTLVILDEAYFEFASRIKDYPDSMDYRYDNVITLRTFSKAYGIAGVRVGYGFAHGNLIGYLKKVKLPFEPGLISQCGAVGAIEDHNHLIRTLDNNDDEYVKIWNYLRGKGLNTIDSVTNFICFRTGSAEASTWIYEHLLNHGVIIRPLMANGMPDYIRVSIGKPSEMNHFYEAMDDILPEFFELFGEKL